MLFVIFNKSSSLYFPSKSEFSISDPANNQVQCSAVVAFLYKILIFGYIYRESSVYYVEPTSLAAFSLTGILILLSIYLRMMSVKAGRNLYLNR